MARRNAAERNLFSSLPTLRTWLLCIVTSVLLLGLFRESAHADPVTFAPKKGGFTYAFGTTGEPTCVTFPPALHDASDCATLGLSSAETPKGDPDNGPLVGVALVKRNIMPFTALASSTPRRFRALDDGELPRDQAAIQELAQAALGSEGEILWESPDGSPAFQKLERDGVAVFRVVAVQNGMSYVTFMFSHKNGTGLVQVLGPKTLFSSVSAIGDEIFSSLHVDPASQAPAASDMRSRYAPLILIACALAALLDVAAFFRDRKRRAELPASAPLGQRVGKYGLTAHGAMFLVLSALAAMTVTDVTIFAEHNLEWMTRLQGGLSLLALGCTLFTLATFRTHQRRAYMWLSAASMVILAAVVFAQQMAVQVVG